MKKLFEGMDYGDLVGVLKPILTVDSYSANMGKDCDIVTLSCVIGDKQAGKDLSDWFERGYDWVLDAEVSDGELTPGKFVVFIEMTRRSSVPAHIVELLDDLDTLTDTPVEDWTVVVDGEEYPAEEEILRGVIPLSPHLYRERNPEDTDDTEEDDEDADTAAEDDQIPPITPPAAPDAPPAPPPAPPAAPQPAVPPQQPQPQGVAPPAPQAPAAPPIPGIPVGGALSEDMALNSMRAIAGLPPKKIFRESDSLLRTYKSLAGL